MRLPCFPALKSSLLLAVLLLSPAAAQQSLAKDRSAKEFLQSIYDAYTRPDGYGVRWRGTKSGRYFDQTLTKLIEKDLKESKGEVGRLDIDPFVHAQNFDLASLKIEILNEDSRRAKGVAAFINMSEPTRIEFDLVNTPQGWRISNIAWNGTTCTMRDILSGDLLQPSSTSACPDVKITNDE